MQQTVLSFKQEASDDFNNFIVSSSNSLAYKHINDWPEDFGLLPYSKTLIIRGPKSSGKSFLAKLWANKTEALFIKKNHELTNSILAHHQAFVIDGFDKNWNEEDILHYFNIIHENGKYLLITLTTMPEIKLADLTSRMNSVNKVDILMLDDDLMKILIFKKFSDFSIMVSDEVINYLVKILPREFPKILSSIEMLNQISLEQKRKITVPLVKESLKL